MVNHPNRMAYEIDDLRESLIPVKRRIKKGSLAKIQRFNNERVVFIVNWVSKVVWLTVLDGIYNPPAVQDGLHSVFEVKYLFPDSRKTPLDHFLDCNTRDGRFSQKLLEDEYQEHIVLNGRRAQEVLDVEIADDADFDEISQETKDKIATILSPYLEED